LAFDCYRSAAVGIQFALLFPVGLELSATFGTEVGLGGEPIGAGACLGQISEHAGAQFGDASI